MKVGRALSVTGDEPAPGMARINGRLASPSGDPVARACVTLGPPIHCAALTDDDGRFVIDVPQGEITWELHFLRDGKEIAPGRILWGPFSEDFQKHTLPIFAAR